MLPGKIALTLTSIIACFQVTQQRSSWKTIMIASLRHMEHAYLLLLGHILHLWVFCLFFFCICVCICVILLIYISNVSLLLGFPLTNLLSHPPNPCFYKGAPLPTHPSTQSRLSALAFPYAGSSSLHRTKGFPSHWCQIRPSSAIYVAGGMGSSMWTLWLVV